ncbi:MAG: acyl-CoA dehydrogenase family protein [Rhizobiaceae bacterium]
MQGLDLGLNETTRMLVETTGRFAREEIAPNVVAHDREDRFHAYAWPKFGEAGLLGVIADEADGGFGFGYVEHCAVLSELARTSAAVAMCYGVHSSLMIDQFRRNATPDQKARYYPGLLSGALIGAIAMTEAEAGSDIVSMRTAATLKGDHYLLNGSKMWITNGSNTNLALVYAKTDPSAGKRGITAFLVDGSCEGFSVGRKLDLWGMRASGSAELIFDNCRVPVENVLGKVNGGVRVLMGGLDFERVIASSQCLGIMQAAVDLVAPYLHERRQFGQPIGEFQLMQGKIADMYATLSACQSYVFMAAAAADRGTITRKDAASVYLFVAERTTQVALQAMQALGANGYSNETSAQRLVRDAKLYEIGGGTTEIRRMLIGREIFAETA